MSSLLDTYLESLGEPVTWIPRSDIDQYGDPINGTSKPIRVIWYDDERMIKNYDNEEVQQLAYIQCTSAIQKGDRITRNNITYPVIGIQKTPTFEGEQFRIANLGMRLI